MLNKKLFNNLDIQEINAIINLNLILSKLKLNALSLFNGISALHLAMDRAQIGVDTVYYSEIDKYANTVTEHHYPNDIALGDVTKWREWDIDWTSIDLVGAGFPCQAWSVDVIVHILKCAFK